MIVRTVCVVAGLLAASVAAAADRPFLLTNSAAAEEDDDDVWALETAWVRLGKTRALSVAPEYAFSPTASLQFEMTRTKDRAAGESASAVEAEAKHLFNHIDRDGFGIGIVAALGAARGERRAWGSSAALEVPLPGRVTGFIEAGRDGSEKLVHGGARWWLKREKLAVDAALVRTRGGGERTSGFVLGIGWYDL